MQELKENMPALVRSEEQIFYYIWIVDLLTNNGVAIKLQDAPALAAFAINLALLDSCAFSIADEGMTLHVRGDRGMITKVNPAIALQKEAQTALRFYFKEFQMSPNSRGSNLAIPPSPKGKDNDGFDDL